MELIDVTSRVARPELLAVLTPSVGYPTPEKLAALADRYTRESSWSAYALYDGDFVVGIVGLVGIIAIIAIQWRKAQQAGYEATLKAKMIERGFSADEITKVVGVSTAPRRKHRHQAPFYREHPAAIR